MIDLKMILQNGNGLTDRQTENVKCDNATFHFLPQQPTVDVMLEILWIQNWTEVTLFRSLNSYSNVFTF